MRTLKGRFEFKPIGRCIYCGDDQRPLGLEHIIPLALKGQMQLPEASCKACSAITSAFEGRCCSQLFNPMRKALGYPSRHRGAKHKKKEMLPVWFLDAQRQLNKIELPALESPLGLLIPMYERPPARLCGPLDFSPRPTGIRVWQRGPKEHQAQETAQKIGASAIVANIDMLAFARLLAKIGHAFASAALVDGTFRPYLLDLILGRSTVWTPFIGGDFTLRPPIVGRHYTSLYVHDVSGRSVLGCQVRLFSQYGSPTHLVAVGELTTSEQEAEKFDP